MTFALTKYIYPIKSKVILSEKLGYTLDNPRTEEEIEIVKKFISETIETSKAKKGDLVAPLMTRYNFGLDDFIKYLKKKAKNSYELKYYTSKTGQKLIDIVASSWIIVRYEEDKEFEENFKEESKLIERILFHKPSSYVEKFEKLANYCSLLSLLANDDTRYHGESFLLHDNAYEIFSSSRNPNVYEAIERITGFHSLANAKNRGITWRYWVDVKKQMLAQAKRLEVLMEQAKTVNTKRNSQKQTPLQKLNHIGSVLKTSFEHLQEPRLMLLLLTSIIEYLVTRNPDTSKFNVEDSISKQFRLKSAVLIHNQNKSYDLVKLEEELNKIYTQRSDLAHGNYKEKKGVDEEILNSVLKLYYFLNCILNQYISDRAMVEYLKDN